MVKDMTCSECKRRTAKERIDIGWSQWFCFNCNKPVEVFDANLIVTVDIETTGLNGKAHLDCFPQLEEFITIKGNEE